MERGKVPEEQNNILKVVKRFPKTQTNLLETSETVLEMSKKLRKESKILKEPTTESPKMAPEGLKTLSDIQKRLQDAPTEALQKPKLTTETTKKLPEPTLVLKMPKEPKTPNIVAKVPIPVLETSLTPTEMPKKVISEIRKESKSKNDTDSVTEVCNKVPETLRHHTMAVEVVKEEPKVAPVAKYLPLEIQKVAAPEKLPFHKASPTKDSERLKQILHPEKDQQQGRYDYNTINNPLFNLLNSTS